VKIETRLEVKFGGCVKKCLKIEETSIRNNGQIRSFGRGEFVHLSIFDAMFKAGGGGINLIKF
jgi:hypothetical protein